MYDFALESGADSIESESASFPLQKEHLHQQLIHLIPSMQVFLTPQGGTLFVRESFLYLLLPILAMYDDQNH